MTELTDLSVAQIRDGFRKGEFTAREVAGAFNANVAAAKALNAFIVETPDHALAAADAADKARAEGKLLPLSGVPIGMKDLFCTQGVQTTAASHMLEGFVPTYESTVSRHLAVLKSAGLVDTRKEGPMIFYRLRVQCLEGFFSCIETVVRHGLEREEAAVGR